MFRLSHQTARRGLAVTGRVAGIALAAFIDLTLWGGSTDGQRGPAVPAAVVYLSAVVVFGTLLVRRRRPVFVYVLTWSYCVVWGTSLPQYQPFVALLIAIYEVARRLTLRRALPLLSAAVVPFTINTMNYVQLGRISASAVAFIALVWGVLAGGAWLAGRFGLQIEREARLREVQSELQRDLAVSQERLHLARELHDVIAHSVTAILWQATGTLSTCGGDDRVTDSEARHRAERSLETIRSSATDALRELRQMLGLLHNEQDGADQRGLDELPRLLRTAEVSGVDTTLRETGTRLPLDVIVQAAAYRLVQEAVTNIIKHGGAGSSAEVNLTWGPTELIIVVTGHEPARDLAGDSVVRSGYGLRGMQERIDEVGGELATGWEDADHFFVRATVPVQTAQPLVRSSVLAAERPERFETSERPGGQLVRRPGGRALNQGQ